MYSALFIDKGGDSFFIGDLDKAKALAMTDRTVHEVTSVMNGVENYVVELTDCENTHSILDGCPDIAEWGASMESMVDAWRYALAAYLGPIDEEYQGDEALLRLLDGEVPDA